MHALLLQDGVEHFLLDARINRRIERCAELLGAVEVNVVLETGLDGVDEQRAVGVHGRKAARDKIRTGRQLDVARHQLQHGRHVALEDAQLATGGAQRDLGGGGLDERLVGRGQRDRESRRGRVSGEA